MGSPYYDTYDATSFQSKSRFQNVLIITKNQVLEMSFDTKAQVEIETVLVEELSNLHMISNLLSRFDWWASVSDNHYTFVTMNPSIFVSRDIHR